MIQVAIVADSFGQGQGLADLLADDADIEVVLVSVAGPRIREDQIMFVDVILATPDSRLTQFPKDGPGVLVIGDYPGTTPALRRPVRGWLPANVAPAELSAAIAAVAQHFVVLTTDQANGWLPPDREDEDGRNFESLTPRELQILRMLGDGFGNKEIAVRLGISGHTVKFHVAQVLAKLGAGSRAEAVALGMRRGLVPV